jgi:hypothetical protein
MQKHKYLPIALVANLIVVIPLITLKASATAAPVTPPVAPPIAPELQIFQRTAIPVPNALNSANQQVNSLSQQVSRIPLVGGMASGLLSNLSSGLMNTVTQSISANMSNIIQNTGLSNLAGSLSSLFGGGSNPADDSQQKVKQKYGQGVNDAIGKFSNPNVDSAATMTAAAELLEQNRATGTLSETVNYVKGVNDAAAKVAAQNPGAGSPAIVQVLGSSAIAKSVTGAVGQTTIDAGANEGKKTAAEVQQIATDSKDSSLEVLEQIKEQNGKSAAINAQLLDINGKILTISAAQLEQSANDLRHRLEAERIAAIQSTEAQRQIELNKASINNIGFSPKSTNAKMIN